MKRSCQRNHTKRDIYNKKNKRLQLQGEIREIRINYFIRKKSSDEIETFKIINKSSDYGRHFSMFFLELKIYS